MVIHKYVLEYDKQGNAFLTVPEFSTLLKAGVQEDKIVLWYMITTPDNTLVTSRFKVAMTGEIFASDGLEYIDTVTLHGWLVCHIFRVTYI